MISCKRDRLFPMTCLVGVCLALCVTTVHAQTTGRATQNRPAYSYYAIGNVKTPTPGKTSAGVLMMGGGGLPGQSHVSVPPRFVEQAFKWFVGQAGHGHIVILSYWGRDHLQNWIYHNVGGVESVQTVVIHSHSRAIGSDPRLLAIVNHADGVFFRGGHQRDYVNYWKGTPLNAALNADIQAGKPVGGASAGLAILGHWVYAALIGSLQSRQALMDPGGSTVTLVDDFLSIPQLKGTITDTHFLIRKRLGRLLGFEARLAKDYHTAAFTGLGIDQEGALLVDADGSARLVAEPGHHAWVVVPEKLREVERAGGQAALEKYLKGRVAPGKPLDVPGFVVTGLSTASRLHLPDYKISDPAFKVRIDVVNGKPVEHVMMGKVPDALEK